MNCEEARPRLGAFLDGELVEAERAALRDHLAGCADCGPEITALERLREGIQELAPPYRAPAALRSQIRLALRREQEAGRSRAWGGPGWLAYAASLMIAVAVGAGGTYSLLGERQESAIASEVIDSHLRSLLVAHLTDVASSDRHTVKPWFAGRTDLSPPAVDLAAEGFPLAGGRLDLIAKQPIPALVYNRRQHIINLFVMPARPGEVDQTLARHGISVRHWTQGDLGLWAVSDAAPAELAEFERVFRAATPG
jgi:anti-sigma factor RsiW